MTDFDLARRGGVVHNGMGLAWLFREFSRSGRVGHGELKAVHRHGRRGAGADRARLVATALLIIDMQRDFMEPGGFGETLGNDVSQLARAVKPIAAVLEAARDTGMLVVHTREGHLPDLSDAPPAKVERGAPSLRIGDPGPMGRILIRGEAGHDIIPELYPLDSEIVIDKPGKGAFYATELGDVLQKYGIENLAGVRRHHRSLRQHHGARGQRPRLSLRRARRWLRILFSRISRDGPEDDQGPGRHLRLGLQLGRGTGGTFTGDFEIIAAGASR